MADSVFEQRGMRDFFPADWTRLQSIFKNWHQASRQYAFQEWEGPILETQALYKAKSGEEIVDQLYAFTDKGGREVAIRAEMTPTLARMLIKRLNTLPRPLKWYNIARCCRYERPSMGRLREFFQWNIDLLGEEQGLADAEVMAVACTSLEQFGLEPGDYALHINDRSITSEFFKAIGIPEEKYESIMTVIDKVKKVETDAAHAMLLEQGITKSQLDRLWTYLGTTQLAEAKSIAEQYSLESFDSIYGIITHLEQLGFTKGILYDPTIVRGLAYYTGAVFEIYAKTSSGLSRAICGGGRYDNLLDVLGGSSLLAVGFGMGDVVLGLFLEDRKLLSEPIVDLDYYLIRFSDDELPAMLQLAQRLRAIGKTVDYSFRAQNMGKQMKKANQSQARFAIILAPEELHQGKVRLKNLKSGTEEEVSITDFSAPV
jgi:histidyl-tRNA synthetase